MMVSVILVQLVEMEVKFSLELMMQMVVLMLVRIYDYDGWDGKIADTNRKS